MFTEQLTVLLTTVNICTEFISNLEIYVSASTYIPRKKHLEKKSFLNSYPASVSTNGKTEGDCLGSF